jgi:hypothetical protein
MMKLGRMRHKGFRFALMGRCVAEIVEKLATELQGMRPLLQLTPEE